MQAAEGFRYDKRKNGDIVIFHHGRLAKTLSGTRASEFVASLTADETPDRQELMSQAVKNHKRDTSGVTTAHDHIQQTNGW